MNKRSQVGFGLALLAACVVGYFLRARAVDRGWEQMLGELEAFDAAHPPATGVRPVLYGEQTTGDAYPRYLQAAKLAGYSTFGDLWAQWAKDEVVLQTPQYAADDYTEYSISEVFADAGPQGDEHRRAVLELGARSLAALAAGAHAERYGPPEADFEAGAMQTEDWTNLIDAFRLGWMQLREHAVLGRNLDCAGAALDLVQVCCDLMGSAGVAALTFERYAWPAEYVEAWLESGELARLGDEALAVLEAGLLRALQNVQPFSNAWPAHVSVHGRLLQAHPVSALGFYARIGAMHRVGHGELYSVRLDAANQLRKSMVLVDRLHDVLSDGLGSVGAAAALFEARGVEASDRSPRAYSLQAEALRDRARVQVNLRLLASGLAILRGAPERKTANLGDPYLAQRLTVSESPERIVLSVDGHPDWRLEIAR